MRCSARRFTCHDSGRLCSLARDRRRGLLAFGREMHQQARGFQRRLRGRVTFPEQKAIRIVFQIIGDLALNELASDLQHRLAHGLLTRYHAVDQAAFGAADLVDRALPGGDLLLRFVRRGDLLLAVHLREIDVELGAQLANLVVDVLVFGRALNQPRLSRLKLLLVECLFMLGNRTQLIEFPLHGDEVGRRFLAEDLLLRFELLATDRDIRVGVRASNRVRSLCGRGSTPQKRRYSCAGPRFAGRR